MSAQLKRQATESAQVSSKAEEASPQGHDFHLEEEELLKMMGASEEAHDTTNTLILDRSINPLLGLLKCVGESHEDDDAIKTLKAQMLRFCHEIVHTIVAEQIPVGALVLLMIKLLMNDRLAKTVPKHKFAKVITAHLYGVPLLDLGHADLATQLKAQVDAIEKHQASHTVCHFGTEEEYLSKIPTSKLVSFIGSRMNVLYSALDLDLSQQDLSEGIGNVISPFHIKQFASWRKHRDAPECDAEKFLFTRLQDIVYEARGDLPFSFLNKKEADTTPSFKVSRAPKYLFDLVVSIIFPKTEGSNVSTQFEMNPLFLNNVLSIRTTEHAYMVQISLLNILSGWFMSQISTMDIPSYYFSEAANKDWEDTDLSANPLTKGSFTFAPQKVYVDAFKKDGKVISASVASSDKAEATNEALAQMGKEQQEGQTLDGLMSSSAWKS